MGPFVSEPPFKGSVLLVAEPMNPGGIAVYTRSLMEGLRAAEISHPLLTSVRPGPGVFEARDLNDVHVINGLFWSVWRPFIFRKLVAWAREREPVLIHGLSALVAPTCFQLSKALEVPYVITVHHFQKPGGLRVEQGCHSFIAVSEPLRENLVNDARIPREMVRVIPAGIRVPRDLAARPAEYGGVASVPLISSVGKLIQRKDYATFIRAARIVVDKLGKQCSFVILGEGPEESSLRKLAKELKLDKNITFADYTTALRVLLRDTDVYVQCSKAEGFGTMVLQAMAHGVPVVATSTGGILTLMRDGETGFLVPVGDAEALASRILNVLTDRALSVRLGETARQEASENYDLNRMMSATMECYADAAMINTKTTTKV
jgi:glycosyltransferase involved in cell wall biosynthesis